MGILVVIKTGRFCSFTQFSWAIAHCFFGSGDNFVGILGSHQNWSILSFHAVFMGYCTLFWSPEKIWWAFMAFTKTRRFDYFSQFSRAIAPCFGVRENFVGISGSHQNSSIWSVIALFMSYSTLFGGLGIITWAFW